MSELRRRDRFEQQSDRDPTHDELHVELLGTWKERIRELPGFPADGILGEGNIAGENLLYVRGVNGPVFPAAIVRVEVLQGHTKAPVKLWGSVWVAFEIKTKVDSFGGVLRQLRLYKSGRSSAWGRDRDNPRLEAVVLFTPDKRFDTEFIDQGFPVLHPRKTIVARAETPAGTLDAYPMDAAAGGSP